MTPTLTITRSSTVQQATVGGPAPAPVKGFRASWAKLHQEVVSYGAPSDAGEGGRLAVRENAEALRILRDA